MVEARVMLNIALAAARLGVTGPEYQELGWHVRLGRESPEIGHILRARTIAYVNEWMPEEAQQRDTPKMAQHFSSKIMTFPWVLFHPTRGAKSSGPVLVDFCAFSRIILSVFTRFESILVKFSKFHSILVKLSQL